MNISLHELKIYYYRIFGTKDPAKKRRRCSLASVLAFISGGKIEQILMTIIMLLGDANSHHGQLLFQLEPLLFQLLL